MPATGKKRRELEAAAVRMRRYRERKRAQQEGQLTAHAAAAEALAAARAEHGLLQSHGAALDRMDTYTQEVEASLLTTSDPAGGGDDPRACTAVEALVERVMTGLASRLLLSAPDSQLRQADTPFC
jgi:hypothetical protein